MTHTPGQPTGRRYRHPLVPLLALLLFAAPVFGGCASQVDSPGDAGAQSTQTSSAPSDPSAQAPQQDPAPAEAGSDASDIIRATPTPDGTQGALGQTLVVGGHQGAGVSVSVAAPSAITATAQGPGEVSGPALRLEVTVDNTSGTPVDLSNTAVTLTDSAGNPGSGMLAAPAAWLDGELGPGQHATGTYVFTLPEGTRDPITVTVQVSTTMETAEFSGNAS